MGRSKTTTMGSAGAALSGRRGHDVGLTSSVEATAASRIDRATVLLILAAIGLVFWTFRDYAISNDEVLQHRYGELIIAYYRSGLIDRSVFSFENLYLYGGLFDLVAVTLSQWLPVDPYHLRHLLCALTGIGGIAAAAATAREIAGPRAGLLTALSLALSGAWVGAMFNHTKDIPFAAAMMGATFFLLRLMRAQVPRPADLLGFGLLCGAALGLRILGLLLIGYVALAMLLRQRVDGTGPERLRDAASFTLRLLPAFLLAYLVMIIAWPWAALAPLNPIRGLLAFSEFHYDIRTYFAGRIYEMAEVPRIFVPVYVLIRMPLLVLAGAGIAFVLLLRRLATAPDHPFSRGVALLTFAVIVPLACQIALHGPAFTGMRHFLFVVPPLAVLAGIGIDRAIAILEKRTRAFAAGAMALVAASLIWDATLLVRLHPYENLYYNALVGGLPGAFRRYDLDYWFNSMPEAIAQLEAYVRDRSPGGSSQPMPVYSVAVCGERLSFERNVTLPQLRWDFKPEWNQSEFFIAPTHMNCDRDLDGEIVATIQRLGVPIAYVKDRRALTSRQVTTAQMPAPPAFP